MTRAGREVELTPREFALLLFLARRAGEVVPRTELLEHVWDESDEGSTNVVDVYVGYLRKKLERPFRRRRLIRTVRGIGFMLEPQVRLPIRVRLTAWYAVLLAIILAGLSTFLVLQLRADLEDTVDVEVRSGSAGDRARVPRPKASRTSATRAAPCFPTAAPPPRSSRRAGGSWSSFGEPLSRRLLVPKEAVGRALAGRAADA